MSSSAVPKAAIPSEADLPDRWKWCPVELSNGRSFGVVVDLAELDDITGALARGGQEIDWTAVLLMCEVISPGDLVLDLGAHVGMFTLAAAAVGCTVVAVEAAPSNAALLRASVERNGFDRVDVVQAAVGDAVGEVGFVAQGPFGFVGSDPANGNPDLVIPSVTVDGMLADLGLPGPAFVKMDIEGSEIRALRGMASTLSGSSAPVLVVESNGHTLGLYGETPGKLLVELDDLGYRAFILEPGRLIETPPDQVQLKTVVDYLAVKEMPDAIHWQVDPRLSVEDRIERMMADCNTPSAFVWGQRAYVARALAGVGPEILGRQEVVELLAAMRADGNEAVRAAAAWSAIDGPRLGDVAGSDCDAGAGRGEQL